MSYPFENSEHKSLNFKSENSEQRTRVKYEITTMTIAEFMLNILPITDCNPIGQRPGIFLEPDNDKNVGIITNILNGEFFNCITLVDASKDSNKWTWESLDGGHRKRAIRDFFENKFSVNGWTYATLPDELKEIFMNYRLVFARYEPLSNFMKGIIFRNLNKGTDVNPQETLNSYGDDPMANVVRETVRVVSRPDGKTSVSHELFEVNKADKFKWIASTNKRLKQEEWVAQVYYSFYNGGKLGDRRFAKLEKMYKDETIDPKRLKKKVDKFLDFLYELAKSKRAGGLKNDEKNTLLNLYLYLSESYGSDLEAINYLEWYRAFSVVFDDIYYDPDNQYKDIIDLPFESAETSISQRFRDYSRNIDSAEKQTQMIVWMTSHSKWEKVLEQTLLKDRTRAFPRWMKEVALQKQDFVCVIDGLPLVWEEAEAAHIKAHANGGKTQLNNLAMVRKVYNKSMGTIDLYEYKKMYDEQKKVA